MKNMIASVSADILTHFCYAIGYGLPLCLGSSDFCFPDNFNQYVN